VSQQQGTTIAIDTIFNLLQKELEDVLEKVTDAKAYVGSA
jgi:hypothetical protein